MGGKGIVKGPEAGRLIKEIMMWLEYGRQGGQWQETKLDKQAEAQSCRQGL